MQVHIWVTRAHCSCGYFWTTPGSPSVVCACGQCRIEENIIVAGSEVGENDESAFQEAVSVDLARPLDQLVIAREGA